MIEVTYRLRVVTRRCPVDVAVLDVYDVTVEADRMIEVEQILAAVPTPDDPAMFQEAMTEDLADALDAVVTSEGVHSGVLTRCVARPRT